MKIPGSHPFPFSSPGNGLTVENMKRKLEVSKGLLQSAEGLPDFDIHPQFFLDMVF